MKNIEEKILMLHDKWHCSPQMIHWCLDDRVAGLSRDAALVVLVSSHLHVSLFTPGRAPAGRTIPRSIRIQRTNDTGSFCINEEDSPSVGST